MSDDTLQVGSKVAVIDGRFPRQSEITRETKTQWIVGGFWRFNKSDLHEYGKKRWWAARIEPWTYAHQETIDGHAIVRECITATSDAQHLLRRWMDNGRPIAAVRKLREAVREFIEGAKQ